MPRWRTARSRPHRYSAVAHAARHREADAAVMQHRERPVEMPAAVRRHIGKVRPARIGVDATQAGAADKPGRDPGIPQIGDRRVIAMSCIGAGDRRDDPEFPDRAPHAQRGVIGAAVDVGGRNLQPLPYRRVVADAVVAAEPAEIVEDAADRRPESPGRRENELASGAPRHQRGVALTKRKAAILFGDPHVMPDEGAGEIEFVGQVRRGAAETQPHIAPAETGDEELGLADRGKDVAGGLERRVRAADRLGSRSPTACWAARPTGPADCPAAG